MVPQRFAAPDITAHAHTGIRGVGIVLAAVMAILVDQTAATLAGTALPYFQGVTATSPDEASWILTGFNAPYYAFVLFSPWLMARFGLRRLLITSLFAFSIVSMLLLFTSDFSLFVGLRVLQGALQGCIYVPAVVLIFTSLPIQVLKFAPPAFVFIALSGATFGTAISGALADAFNGNIVFLPGAVATLATALLLMVVARDRESKQPELKPDIIGLSLSVGVFCAIQYLSNEGERKNWLDDPTIAFAFFALALFVPAFLLYELFVAADPHVDLRMFTRHRNLSVGAATNLIIGAAGYSVTLLIGYLETALGATPSLAGLLVIVRVATYAIGIPLSFYFLVLKQTMDARLIVRIGAIGSAMVLVAFAQTMTTTAEINTFIRLSLAFGLFFGLLNQPLGALVIGSMPLPLLAAGISIYKMSAPLGSIAATAIMQTVFDHDVASYRNELAGTIVLRRPTIANYAAQHHGHAGSLTGLAIKQAHTLAYAHGTLIVALLLLTATPLIQLAHVKKVEPKVENA
jgi:DHA2 family multidrug resistance protein